MKTNHLIKALLLACLLALVAQPAIAGLKITLVFTGGTPPTPDLLVGGGNLHTIMEVAAAKWESVFKNGPDNWNLTVYYGWGSNLVDNLYGQERMLEQGGNPVRITRSEVLFHPNPPLPEQPGSTRGYFADPTPWNNSAYTVYESTKSEYYDQEGNPVGQINVGRVLTGPNGLAAGRIDLLTLATHEIGHALGLDGDYDGFKAQINGSFLTITPPRPYADAFVAMIMGFADHIATPDCLMVAYATPGQRNLITGIDALVLAQLSSFDRPYLGEPKGVPKVDDDQGDGEQ